MKITIGILSLLLVMAFSATYYPIQVDATLTGDGSVEYPLGVTPSFSSSRLATYTVGTLPSGSAGEIAYVTDALAPSYHSVVVGGGAIGTPVFFNGSNWVAH